METIAFDSHGTRCEASYVVATSDALEGPAGRPCVVMGHGFAGTRDSGLLPFAERFAAAGCDVLAFDYRGFGTSGGDLRQDVDHRRHREDYHAALAAARAREGVDPDRVVLWGSSYSGGHVVVVAAQDQRVAALISQGAAMDGLAALRHDTGSSGSGKTARLVAAAVRDLVGRTPVMMPVVGPAGSDAVLSSPSSEAGYSAITGPTFRNEMRARGVLRIPLNRPVRYADRVTCPAFVVIAEQDDLAPVSAVRRVVQILGTRAESLSLDCGHFDIYVGDVLERNLAAQVDFLRRVLAP